MQRAAWAYPLVQSGTDTLSSARAVARLLRAPGIAAPVFATSSLDHVPPCVLLLRMFGMAVRCEPTVWAGGVALADTLLLVAARGGGAALRRRSRLAVAQWQARGWPAV
jgi:hypothetical protein